MLFLKVLIPKLTFSNRQAIVSEIRGFWVGCSQVQSRPQPRKKRESDKADGPQMNRWDLVTKKWHHNTARRVRAQGSGQSAEANG